MDLPEKSAVSEVVGHLADRYNDLPGWASTALMAVNYEYQNRDYVLSDGDEVALIPPVSGGCL